MFDVNFSAKFFAKILLLASIVLCSFQGFAQKKSKKPVSYQKKNGVAATKKRTTVNDNNRTISTTDESPIQPNRIDALIQRNRNLSTDINQLNQVLSKQSSQILSQEGVTNYYRSILKTSRDSTAVIQKTYNDYKNTTDSELASLKTAFADSMEAFNTFRKQASKDRNRVVKDTNVVRVYTMPYDQVRVRVLRKILDEGIGLVIERNTDEGFLVSKVFKDRKSKGLFKKTIETRVDCDIRMVQHPYEDNKTLFYTTTRVQEKSKKDSQFIELTDDKLIKDYQKKLLKFFDDFLVSN